MTDYSTLKLDKGYWYMATPYTSYEAGMEQANKDAAFAGGTLLGKGVHIFSPITHSHIMVNVGADVPHTYEVFLKLDEQMMTTAHGCLVVMMPGWDKSKGVTWEIEWFKQHKKPVVYLAWPLDNAKTAS